MEKKEKTKASAVMISPVMQAPKRQSSFATSQHQKGEAADIKIPCVTTADGTVKQDLKTARRWLAWLMDNTRFDQLILERNKHGFYWIHVSLKRVGVNRQSCILGLVKK